jgi:hypothetical protein
MDTLHTVLRSIRETKARRDHLDIFREFLGHLDRIGRGTRPRSASEGKRTAQDEITPSNKSHRVPRTHCNA